MSFGIEARKRTWQQLLDMDSDTTRALVLGVSSDTPDMPPLWREKKQERIEWAWESYTRHMERIEWLDDDSVPFLNNITGTELFAEAFGCDVHRPPESNPCAMPLIHGSEGVSKLKVPDLD